MFISKLWTRLKYLNGQTTFVIFSVIMLSVVILSVVMLSVVMLSVVMLSIVMLSVVMLSVVAPFYKLCSENCVKFKLL
jgi:hypothetical protein